jgi:hypothetical protein
MSLTHAIEHKLARIGCFAAEPSAETLRLEAWCRIGSDLCIGFAIGFVAVAIMTW